MFVTCIVTCLTYGTSLLAVAIVNNFAVTCPLQKLSGVATFAPLQECEWNVDFPAYNLTHLTLHSHATKLGLRSTSSNAIKRELFNLVPRVSLLCLPWSLEERPQPRSQGLSSLPPLVKRPREAEKRDPGNEVGNY